MADIDAALDACPVDPGAAATVVGVAGTTLSVVAGTLDLPAYDPDVIDQSVVPVADVLAFVDRLVAMPVAERLALPWMHPGRADVIDAGALVLAARAPAYPRRHPGRLRGRHPRRASPGRWSTGEQRIVHDDLVVGWPFR